MKKEYMKPEVKAFEISNESTIIATSGGPGMKPDPLGDGLEYD